MFKTLGFLSLGAAALFGVSSLGAADSPRLFPSPKAPEQLPAGFNLEELQKTPEMYSASGGDLVERDGIRPIFFDGVSMNGKPTRVFAWLGVPPGKPPGEKLPGIVLVHGAGGAAFRHWVKLWMDRGYVAIAMDTGGKMTTSMEEGNRPSTSSHEFSAAPSAGGGFSQADKPLDQQWPYHAVAAVVRANSLLRSLPEVDPERIGLTGISWGGILTELAAGVDSRFKFAAPVYGCGFLGENSFWLENDFQKIPPATVEKWIALWDPSQYVGRITMPMLFCNGTNDKHFRPDSWQKTYRLARGPVTLSMKVRMVHGHPPVGDPKEITVFADSLLKGGKPLAKILSREQKEGAAIAFFTSEVPVTSATLVFTRDSGDWMLRTWEESPATIAGNQASAQVPADTTAWFLNLVDERGCIVSTEHWSIGKDGN